MAKSRKYRKSKNGRRRVHKKKSRKMRKKRGGGVNGPLAAAPFLPPNGPVNVPVPGITNEQVQQYYYAKNNRVVPNPKSTNSIILKKYKGGKRKYKKRRPSRKGRKSRKSRRKMKRRRRRTRRHRGGSLSRVIEAIPGGTDLRDVYYKTTNNLGNLYSQYTGYGPRNEPPMSNYVDQPIAHNGDVDGHTVPLAQYVGDGSSQAAKPQFSADYN
jgi:hypothetical protein